MRTPLPVGTHLTLSAIGTQQQITVQIQELIGTGASCLVYTAVCRDGEQNEFYLRLKEFCPENLHLIRQQDGSLLAADEEAFQRQMQSFIWGYQKQMQFRQFPESCNSISNVQGVFAGNGTRYIAMNCQNSIPLEQQELSLYDTFRVLRAVAQQLDNLHQHGYLYLDLKPANVLLYPETPELVMLFDFDSAIEKSRLSDAVISCTAKWAAPEVLQQNRRRIGVVSDVYTLGGLLLYLLFRRAPEVKDRRSRAVWDAEFPDSVLAGTAPEIRRMVTELLRKTLSANPEKRYASCAELLAQIEPFLDSFRQPKPYLQTKLPLGNNYFCGRDIELQEIHTLLQQEKFLLLHGVGGIGKTELAKHYAMTYAEEYDAVVFVRFLDSMENTILSDTNFPIVHCTRSDGESDAAYLERKLQVLRQICTPRHLILLDNFDTGDCENLDFLTELPCPILVTSRVDYDGIFPQYEVDILSDESALYQMMAYYTKREPDLYTDAILKALNGHTMAVELVAKQMALHQLTSREMYEKLCAEGISGDDGKVRQLKDSTLREKTAFHHMEILFSVLDLSESEKQVLRCAALVGATPMERQYFEVIGDLNEAEINSLDRLIQSGWISEVYQNEMRILSTHPLIVEVLCEKLRPNSRECKRILIMSGAVASYIEESENAEQRFVSVQWLDHMAHHIQGDDPELSYFFGTMCYPLYLGEDRYEDALWAAQQELRILRLEEDSRQRQFNALSFIRDIAAQLHDTETSEKAAAEIAELHLSAEEQLSDLSGILLGYITDRCDFEGTKSCVEQILQLAEEIGEPMKLASAYSNFILLENAYWIDCNSAFYLEKTLFYADQCFAEQTAEQEQDISFWSELGDIYRDCEQFSRAMACYQKERELFQVQMQEEPMEASTKLVQFQTDVAVCNLKMKQFSEMEENYEEAIALANQLYGEEHEETGEIWAAYACALIDWYNAQPSRELLEKCKAAMEQALEILLEHDVYGEVRIANLMMRYSSVLSELGEFQNCNIIAAEALECFQKNFGELHEQMQWAYLMVGDNYHKAGDKENAKRYYDLAIRVLRENDYETDELEERVEEILQGM